MLAPHSTLQIFNSISRPQLSLLVKTMLGLFGLRMEECAALRQLRLGFVSGDNVPNKLYCYCPTVTAKLPFL